MKVTIRKHIKSEVEIGDLILDNEGKFRIIIKTLEGFKMLHLTNYSVSIGTWKSPQEIVDIYCNNTYGYTYVGKENCELIIGGM